MHQHQRGRGTKVLWGLLLVAIAYGGLLYYRHTLTGRNTVDGMIGVILGLYVCSHPAANAVDALFLARAALRQVWSKWSGIRWLALNVVVALAGWLVIVSGAMRFAG
ncbi:MAG: hypothetical protein HY332_11775 [Chloroflexi bacterium]|nr:hypothetical protein [Chloroflexota bacterium]